MAPTDNPIVPVSEQPLNPQVVFNPVRRLEQIRSTYEKTIKVPYLEGHNPHIGGWAQSPILFLGVYFLQKKTAHLAQFQRSFFIKDKQLHMESLGALRSQIKDFILAEFAVLYDKYGAVPSDIGGFENATQDNKEIWAQAFETVRQELSQEFPLDFLANKEASWKQSFLDFLERDYLDFSQKIHSDVGGTSISQADNEAHTISISSISLRFKKDFDNNISFFYSKEERLAWFEVLKQELQSHILTFLQDNPRFLTQISQEAQLSALSLVADPVDTSHTSQTPSEGSLTPEGYLGNYDTTASKQSKKTQSSLEERDINDFNPAEDEEFLSVKQPTIMGLLKPKKKEKTDDLFAERSIGEQIFDFFYYLIFPVPKLSLKEQQQAQKVELSAQTKEALAQSAMPRLFRIKHEIYILIEPHSVAYEEWSRVRQEIDLLARATAAEALERVGIVDISAFNLLEPDIQLASSLTELLALEQKSQHMVSSANRTKLRESITQSLSLIAQQIYSLRQHLSAQFESRLIQQGAALELLQNQRTPKDSSDILKTDTAPKTLSTHK